MKFCGGCGAALRNKCSRCGVENPPEFKFCGECGLALTVAREAIVDVKSASPIVETAVRVRLEQDAADASGGERKTVTALFADIKGSMDLMEGLDPEEARAIVDPALKLMIDAMHRYDGYIVQSTGDGIFALFGAPVAHEDHAQRGLYAALRVQEDMAKYSAGLRAAGNPPVEIRVGLNTGEVVVRSIRTDDAHTEYTPIGHSMSLAARMQTLAPTGSIVITEQTQKLTAGYFDLKPLGAARIKGVSDPINVYEVISIGPLRTRLQMSASRGLSKFVGRRAELEQLDKALELARGGHGQIVAAMAEAGVGKSRLFYEFKMRRQSECLVLEAFSFSHGKASAYLPVVDLLKTYFRIADRDDERTRREKVTGKVLALDRALEETLPHLFALLGIPSGDAGLEGMDPSIRRRRTREAVKSLIVRESLNQPLILIFEDLHWVDAESEALLQLIADSLGTAQILLMVNYRPEYRHNWGNKSYYTQLRLDPLGPDNAAELLTAMLGDAPALAPLKETIIERTQGNPFFMEEMVQVLFDQGVLVRDGAAAVSLAKPLTSIQIPSTVKGILAARIDKLAPADKDLLQSLAVIGKEFPIGLVRRVVGKPDDELTPMLSNLQGAEFIYEQPAFPENEYTFKHALTQEVAYDSVLMQRRRTIHERTATALEEMFASTLDDHVADLAHHYSRSANAPKAIEYLRRAAEQAGARSAYNDAIGYAREGLRLIATMPDSRERDQIELKIQMMMGPLLVAVQGFSSPELATNIERAQELCRRAGETPEIFGVLAALWSFDHANGQLRESRVLADRLLTMAGRMQTDLATAVAHNAMGGVMSVAGRISGGARTPGDRRRRFRPRSAALPADDAGSGHTVALQSCMGAPYGRIPGPGETPNGRGERNGAAASPSLQRRIQQPVRDRADAFSTRVRRGAAPFGGSDRTVARKWASLLARGGRDVPGAHDSRRRRISRRRSGDDVRPRDAERGGAKPGRERRRPDLHVLIHHAGGSLSYDETDRRMPASARPDCATYRAEGPSPARSGSSQDPRGGDSAASRRRHRSRAMFPARNRDWRAPGSEVMEAAGGDEPGAAVVKNRQSAMRLAQRWRRHSRNSLRDSIRAICARRKPCSKN